MGESRQGARAVAQGGGDQGVGRGLRRRVQGGRGFATDARLREGGRGDGGRTRRAVCPDAGTYRTARDAQHAAPRRGQAGGDSGHQRRSRRHGGARLGVDAPAHVYPLGRGARLQGQGAGLPGRRRGGGEVLHARVRGRVRLRLPQERERRAPHGAPVALQRQQQAADDLRVGLRLARGGRYDRDTDQPGRHRVGHLPLVGCGRPERQ